MVKPIDVDARVPYVAMEDREFPVKDQTIWLLRPLEASELATLEDNLAEGQPRKKGGGLKLKSGTHVLRTLDKGLTGVENFGGENIDLEDLRGKEAAIARANLYNRIPPRIRRELADVITGDAEVDEEEAENLS